MLYGLDQRGAVTFDLRRSRTPQWGLNLVEARLTLASGTAIPTTSQTAKTTVYQTPLGRGSRIALYDTTINQWVPRPLVAEISVAVPSTLFRLFDLYDYWTGTAIALETVNWDQSTYTITGATGAAPPTITTSAAHGRSVGDLVGIAGIVGTVGTDADFGLNNTIATVASTPTATTLTLEGVDTSGLAYTSGGTLYTVPNTRTTALTTQDGVDVKTGDASRRYVGTGMTTGTSGQCETSFGGTSSPPRWLLENAYNPVPFSLHKQESADSWNYTTATFRPFNNRPRLNRVEIVCGKALRDIRAWCMASVENDLGAVMAVGIGADRGNTNAAQGVGAHAVTADPAAAFAQYAAKPGAGFHYYPMLEYSDATGTTTWYGDASTTNNSVQAAIMAQIWA